MKNAFFTVAQGSTKAVFIVLFLVLVFVPTSVRGQTQTTEDRGTDYRPGIAQLAEYYGLISGKRVAVVANGTSLLPDGTHTVDHLLNLGVEVHEVWAPEHGFRGDADAGEHVADGVDARTGLPIRSLYGKNKRPQSAWMQGLDAVLFDIQDVGVRFYTYSTTLSYVLDACIEAGVPLIVFDRANPNGHYVDGPLLATGFESMVGLHPIPVVHGLTMGEYAQVVLGEGWVPFAMEASKVSQFEAKGGLTVVKCSDYSHQVPFVQFQVAPSPNLRSAEAIALYPSLCFFEGTPVSCGRGTAAPFTRFGAPWLPIALFPHEFTPMPDEGSAQPKFQGQRCQGVLLSGGNETKENKGDHAATTPKGQSYAWHYNGAPYSPKTDRINWEPLFAVYAAWNRSNEAKPAHFFSDFFALLAGSQRLRTALEEGWSIAQWQESYAEEVELYKQQVAPYLIYERWK